MLELQDGVCQFFLKTRVSLQYQNYSSSDELKCVAVVQRLGFHAEFLIEKKKRLPQREKTMS